MSWRRVLGIAALLGLIAVAVPLVAPGPGVVQASGRGGEDAGWILGVFGGGLGVGRGAYFDFERVAFVLYLAIPARALKIAIVALIAGFTLAPPLLSLDVFSYISYARLEALYGLNPYQHVPLDVPGDAALAFIERWRDATSAYGPLFTLTSLPLGDLGVGAALWTAKAAIGAATLGLTAIVARLAAQRGLDPRPAAALVALNPLVLVHVVGGPHNDALMMLLAMAGVAALLGGRGALGGVAIVGAVATKVSAVFIAPFALIGAKPERNAHRTTQGVRPRLGYERKRMIAGGAAAAALIAVASQIAFGGGLSDSLAIAGENQHRSSRHSVPVTLANDFGIGVGGARAAALVVYALLVAWLMRWTWRGGDWVRAAGWAGLGLLAATSYLTPWYTVWVLPLAAIARDRALVAGSLVFTGYVLLHQVAL
jgi:alpha-1,6-mannosyltransferase